MSVIQTERLNLRELTVADAPFILQLLNEEGFLRHIGDKGVRSLADARSYILQGPVGSYVRHGFGLYLASLRRDDQPIGICGLVKRDSLSDVDVGFAFLAAHWFQGYASESAAAALKYGYGTVGLKRIIAIVSPENEGSMAVLRKIGLRFERSMTLAEGDSPVNLFVPVQPAAC